MQFDPAILDADVGTSGGEQNFLLCRNGDLSLARGDVDVLISRDLDLPMLRLHLDFALSGDEFEADLVFCPIDEEADVLPDVVQPASATGLVGIAQGDLVEVGAGGQTQVLCGQCGDTRRGGEHHDRLFAGFVVLGL